uniref:peptidyl-tRNA hydrolase n=1 Tax=Phallusia mammillata TaxID=59560 RepID=A0A6F9DQQ2_9ASCI|nr:putative peptidyl-tRNA hydrolase PTRHD1 [Phallusia mammillata]CAB3265306.1 putative peptidyl-tRNA hydrolase PTRHD1 [Phallusia mammillata]
MGSILVQYVILRGDLFRVLNWPVGAIIAQACHACTSVIWTYKEDPNVIEYTKDMDNMRKVVLEAKDEEHLQALSDVLQENKIDFKLWIEQPENTPTCIVVKPYKKDDVQAYFKKCKLFK